jgi:hypothetical protein
MTTDTDIACLDPACGAQFRITRLGERSLHHADYSANPLPKKKPGAQRKSQARSAKARRAAFSR